MQFSVDYVVEWGDCDAAGIVYYPNYFDWLDKTFQKFLRARQLGQRQLMSEYGAVTPLIDVGLRFRAPAKYDDIITVSAEIDLWEERKFRLSYRIQHGDRHVAEGHELRSWATLKDGVLKSAPIPEDFKLRVS